MTGTLINVAAVLVGSCIGLLARKGIPEKMVKIAFQAIGIFTVYIGIRMAWKSESVVILVLSIVSGAIIGEIFDLDMRISRLGSWLKGIVKSNDKRFSEGMISAFLLWCMGSMTILGALDEGISGKMDLLLAKSVLDGFASIALAARLGTGVLFAAIPLLIYQGGITLAATPLGEILSVQVINEIGAVGGLMLLGLGIQILEIKKIKVLNMLPSLLFAAILAYYF